MNSHMFENPSQEEYLALLSTQGVTMMTSTVEAAVENRIVKDDPETEEITYLGMDHVDKIIKTVQEATMQGGIDDRFDSMWGI